MQKNRCMLRRRGIFLFIDSLVLLAFLAIWMVGRKPVATERAISYNRASDHVLVQLAKIPEQPGAQGHPSPIWVLYGDGTLIFRADPDDALWRAHLSPGEIQHILDVIINRNTFFASTAHRYRSMTPERDDEALLLTVDANGQQKEVVLVSERTNRTAIDIQATHVFAIRQFLLGYRPLHTVFYAPDPDQNGIPDDGG